MSGIASCRDLRLAFSLSSSGTDVAITPSYPASIMQAGGVTAQYVRVYVSNHHDNQGYSIELNTCASDQTGACTCV